MSRLRFRQRDALRSGVAGAEAVAARPGAQALFAAAGHRVFPSSLQGAIRGAVEHQASRALGAAGLLEAGVARAALPAAESGAAVSALSMGVRAAGRQVLRSVGAAAGAGALIDGGWALVQAARCVRRGSMTHREAATRVAREAATGAAATAAGTTAAILLVVLTGGVAAPAVFLVGAAVSVGAKAGLDRWVEASAVGEVKVRPETAATP